MKAKTWFIAAAASLVLVACSEEKKLAQQLEGSWSGAPERFTVNDAAAASMTPVFTFERAEGDDLGGNVSIASMISAILPVNAPTDSVILPFKITVSAIGTVNGTWKVMDDDKVVFNLNTNTISVNINPDNITTATDALTDQTLSYWEGNRAAVAKQLEEQIRVALQTRYMALRELDDVEIKNDVLKYEYLEHDFYLHRDGVVN